jgi:hypothetical protein
MTQRGRQPSVIAAPDTLRAATATQLGDASIAKDGLTFGKMVSGGHAGRIAAEYRKVAGTAATTYNIPHSLGFVPAWCILLGCEEPVGTPTVLSANWFEWGKWTATEVRMRLRPDVGNIEGSTMWFLIGGER